MLRPVCDLCAWHGAPTLDLAEAKAATSEHQLAEHGELVAYESPDSGPVG